MGELLIIHIYDTLFIFVCKRELIEKNIFSL